jgi:hypothetical protein
MTLLSHQFKYLGALAVAAFICASANAAALQLAGQPLTKINSGSEYYFNANATGGTGHAVFAIANKPSWATFNTATGELKGKPGSAAVFSHIVISAKDGASTASMPAFAITVVASDASKLIVTGQPQTKTTSGASYYFNANATGGTGQLAFSIANKPAWATFNTVTGELQGKPSAAGTYSNIIVSVSDGVSKASSLPFAIEVVSFGAVKTTAGAKLSWSAPQQNTDGSTLNNLSGYVVHYGTSANALTQKVAIGSAVVTSYTIAGLTAGQTYYFSVAAVGSQDVEGEASGVVSLKM